MKYGFIGVGEIAAAMVEGLLREGQDGEDAPGRTVVLSPRGARLSAELAERHPDATVAASNAEVAASCDVVVVAVRPDQLEDALDGVGFHDGQVVVSVLAGVPLERVRAAVDAEVPVVRAIPLPPVAQRAGMTPVIPGEPAAVELFDLLGGTLVVEVETQLAVITAVTGSCTGALQYVETLVSWATDHGVARGVVEPFTRSIIASLAPALQDFDVPMERVIASHETPGGLNEQLRLGFFGERTTDVLRGELDGLHDRAKG